MTGYWMMPYQSIILIETVAKKIARVRRMELVRPTPERASRRLWSRIRLLESPCREIDEEDGVSLVRSAEGPFSLDMVSGNRKMEMRTEAITRTRLVKTATDSVPPWPSRFISQPPMGGQMAWATYCMEVVRKNRADLSSADGIISVYDAKSIAKPRSKFPPIRANRPVK